MSPIRLSGLVAIALVGCSPDYKLDRAASRIVVSPTLLDLGVVAVGGSATAEVTLTSVAGGQVEVVAAELLAIEGDGFSVDDALPLVPEDGAETLTVTFAPYAAGWHLAQLTITTDEPKDNVHVLDVRGVAGTPAAEVWPALLDFGPVATGASATREVTLANTGDIDLTVGSGVVDVSVFTLATATPVDLPVGTTGTFTVTFSPTHDAPATGSLTFLMDPASPTVALRGNDCANGAAAAYDTDGDGWTACAADCDDGDAAAHPGAAETCDGADQDCDGTVDEGTSCADDDGDGVTEDGGDCNDADAGVSPSGSETYGNGVDDDCDGVIDYGTEDADGDGYAAEGDDCDLADATVYPGAPELEDGLDNDCDGRADEGTAAYDDDGDGTTENGGDCDDADATVEPGAAETADGVDDDCDGTVDEGTSSGDDDGDGWTETGGDCDDADATVHPGAEEVVGDRTDNDCDGSTE